ncbi:hypothetical protein LSH36_885g00052 [Paralvinella palmiformis]|uniref:Uncharacterized protein n=1 Tax=Paralvinella palmiformis TaxID=53620 RepID=A0AAD9MRG4_9ANNE|nr:hypothetical protein LSH36_885g00052 [Paralvinella palmiformis]
MDHPHNPRASYMALPSAKACYGSLNPLSKREGLAWSDKTDRHPRWRGTDTCLHQARVASSRHYYHLARFQNDERSGAIGVRDQRSKYVPYSAAVFESLHSDVTPPETTSSRSEAEVRADMSCGELPPIPNRTGSAKSRRSSRDSSSGGHPVKPSVFRYEKTPLLSASSNVLIEGVQTTGSGRPAIKRAHISAPSNGSSSPSQQSTNPGHPCCQKSEKSQKSQLSRAKSWCATESNAEQSPRLETLFEKNGMISGSYDRKSTAHLADRNKPPRARLRSQAAQTTSSMTVGMRSLSNSVSNLSKTSDTNTWRTTRQTNYMPTNRNKTALQNAHKFKSEQNLTSVGAPARRPEARTSLASKPQQPGGAQDKRINNNKNYKVKTLRSIRSQPQMHVNTVAPSDDNLTTQNLKNIDGQLEDSGSDSDSERNQRIQDWLLGTEQADLPESQEVIVEEKPKQTDTAIHIVYDKD